jgi:hypothetical protein
MLSVFMLSVFMPSVVMLSVVILSVAMPDNSDKRKEEYNTGARTCDFLKEAMSTVNQQTVVKCVLDGPSDFVPYWIQDDERTMTYCLKNRQVRWGPRIDGGKTFGITTSSIIGLFVTFTIIYTHQRHSA